MNTVGEWHVLAADLERYASGESRPYELASVESHLVACHQCRNALRTEPTQGSGAMWARIADRIDEPRRPLRSSKSSITLCFSSPLLIATTLGVALMLLVVVGAAATIDSKGAITLLLVFAPLAPLACAVIAFQPEVDPAGNLAAATPLAAGRLPLLRALSAASVSFPVGLAAGFVVHLPASGIVVWVLPGIAFAALVLAVGTWADPNNVAALVAAGWVAIIVVWSSRLRGEPAAEALHDLVAYQPAARLAFVTVAAVAAAICLQRRDARPNWRTR